MYFISASSVYSVAYFTPIILSDGMGFGHSETLLLTSPPWVCLSRLMKDSFNRPFTDTAPQVFCIIMSILMSFVSDRYRTRWP